MSKAKKVIVTIGYFAFTLLFDLIDLIQGNFDFKEFRHDLILFLVLTLVTWFIPYHRNKDENTDSAI